MHGSVLGMMRHAVVAGLCFALVGCAIPGSKAPTFEVALNRDVRMTLPLPLFENAMIMDTFSVMFSDGASLTISAFSLRDFNYLSNVRDLPEYVLGLRDMDYESADKEKIEDVVGIQRFIRNHVGEDGELRVIETKKGKAYAMIGARNSIAYLTYLSSDDVIIYIDASKMGSDEFLDLIKGGHDGVAKPCPAGCTIVNS